ncbi:MAG TPA: hypothetical protein VHP37_29560 [Burkholderiales bacterium]|nr:hypothetical protein [Burkholderiales bacterium]
MPLVQPGKGRVTVWQCIGCGKIEAPQPCIGVCRDQRTEMIHAADYDALCAQAETLAAIVRQIATITPRDGEWETSYRALQLRAREALRKSGQE